MTEEEITAAITVISGLVSQNITGATTENKVSPVDHGEILNSILSVLGETFQTERTVPLLEENTYLPTLPFFELEESLLISGTRVNLSGGQIELTTEDVKTLVETINRDDEVLTGRFVNTVTGAVGYLDFYNTIDGDFSGTDYFYLADGGSSSYSSSGAPEWKDENGDVITDTSLYPDDSNYEMYVFIGTQKEPKTVEDYLQANKQKWDSQTFNQVLEDSGEYDLNGNSFHIKDTQSVTGSDFVASFNDGQTTLRSLLLQLVGINAFQVDAPQISFNGGATTGLILPRLSTAPTSPVNGSLYYDTSTDEYKKWDVSTSTWLNF